jgi:ABC-type Zn2+ transport system substrate-binding protein/surface adhesin
LTLAAFAAKAGMQLMPNVSVTCTSTGLEAVKLQLQQLHRNDDDDEDDEEDDEDEDDDDDDDAHASMLDALVTLQRLRSLDMP